jgi:YVTN family beta-propeller protein
VTRFLSAAVIGLAVVGASVSRAQWLETTVRVGFRPPEVFWCPGSNRVYAPSYYDNTVWIIDGATNLVRAVLPTGDMPGGICWNSWNNKVYLACGESNEVMVIDATGDSLLTVLHISGYPLPMAYNSALNKLYVGSLDNGYVSVFDGATDALLSRVRVDNVALRVAMLWHPSSNRTFCGTGHDSVKVIDCTSDRIVCGVVTPGCVDELVWNPVNSLVYAVGYQTVHILNQTGDSVVGSVPCKMYGACAVPYSNKLYGGNVVSGVDDIYVLDCASQTVIDSISCRIWQLQMVCDTVGDRVYAVGLVDDVALVIDPRDDSVLMAIPLGRGPEGVAWNWLNHRVYVANGMDTTVSIIRTNVGIEEGPRPVAVGRGRTITVRNGVLEWSAETEGRLLDLSGRVLARLRPGLNRLPDLAPGVYFIQREDGSGTIKAVILR